MNELARQIEGFDRRLGWTPKNSWELVFKCLMFMQHLDKQRFRMFYCAVDLIAWRKLKAETYQLPDPIELCNQCCSEIIMATPIGGISGITKTTGRIFARTTRNSSFVSSLGAARGMLRRNASLPAAIIWN
jgi:hypothetical protein